MRSARRRVRWLLAPGIGALVAGAGPLGCSSSPSSPVGGLELVIATDRISSPASFDSIQLEVQQLGDGGAWVTKWNAPVFPDPTVKSLPATFAIVAGKSPDEEVLITVTALQGTHAVVQRIAQVQVPTGRVASLWLVLASSCVGQVAVCPTGQSCQPGNGECGANVISDVSALPTYVPGQSLDGGVEAGLAVGDARVLDATTRDAAADATTHDAAADATTRDAAADATVRDTWAPEEGAVDAPADHGAGEASAQDALPDRPTSDVAPVDAPPDRPTSDGGDGGHGPDATVDGAADAAPDVAIDSGSDTSPSDATDGNNGCPSGWTCQPVIPSGWTGPVVIETGPTPPNCPDLDWTVQDTAASGGTGITMSGGCGACGCGSPTGSKCPGTMLVQAYGASGCSDEATPMEVTASCGASTFYSATASPNPAQGIMHCHHRCEHAWGELQSICDRLLWRVDGWHRGLRR